MTRHEARTRKLTKEIATLEKRLEYLNSQLWKHLNEKRSPKQYLREDARLTPLIGR